ncbi:heme acquisition ABC transporter HasD, ATP binding protein [Roseobacter sp. GAI101]|nr:heme acquisition ABC transporter HasD, ATP binding protein [Roseobacter sp. GAI101]
MADHVLSNTYLDALKDQRTGFAMVFILSGLVNVLMLTGSVYMLQVYDRVLSSGSMVTLAGLFTIVVILYLFLGLFDFLRQRLLSRIAIRLDVALGKPSYKSWVQSGLPPQSASPEPLRQLSMLRQFLSGPTAVSLFDLPFVPIFLAALFLVHPWLGMMVLAGACVAGIAAILGRVLTRKWQEQAAIQNNTLQEFSRHSRQSAEVLTAMHMHDNLGNHWKTMHETRLALHQNASNPSEVISAFSKTFRLLLQSAILSVGAVLVMQNQISAGMIIASSVLSSRALAPIDQVIGQWRAIGTAVAANRILRDFFAQIGADPQLVEFPEPTGRIAVKSLSKFSPQRGTQMRKALLQSISFDLAPGDGLGVIGKSAAGKSMLARVLVGAWQPDQGEVQLDGASLTKWQDGILGRAIGYLPQRIDLLPGSISQNIARFDPAASDADVIAAAQLAGVHDLINALPDGYASQVGGASGTPLSGGQVQRIGLARAVLFCPKLLVLDEPNAHLDGDGDDALDAAIMKLRTAGSTVIVMAHRPSAISAMNKIMILENGRMVRFDTKEAVLGGANVAPMVRTTGPTPIKPNGARPPLHPPHARGGVGTL